MTAAPIDSIHQFLNVKEETLREAIDKMKTLRVLSAEGERLFTTEKKWQRIKEQILQSLKEFHAGHPLVPGMDMEELRGKLVYELSPKIFRLVVDTLLDEKIIGKEENLLRLASHRVQLGGQEKTLMDKIKKLLAD